MTSVNKKQVLDLLKWHRIFAIAEKLLRVNGYKVIKDTAKWNNPLATPICCKLKTNAVIQIKLAQSR